MPLGLGRDRLKGHHKAQGGAGEDKQRPGRLAQQPAGVQDGQGSGADESDGAEGVGAGGAQEVVSGRVLPGLHHPPPAGQPHHFQLLLRRGAPPAQECLQHLPPPLLLPVLAGRLPVGQKQLQKRSPRLVQHRLP